MRGAFIAIEGIDGSGKTTQTRRLTLALNSGTSRAISTREPHGSQANIWARLDRAAPPQEQALWFAHDRIRHARMSIRPAIDAGRHVICDRYVWSSYAYQGADGCDPDWLREINRHAPAPDLTIYLCSPGAAFIDRIEKREGRTVGAEERGRLLTVQYHYDILASHNGPEVVVIDANRDAYTVAAGVLVAVTAFLATFDGGKPL